jgi:hypothetical protein
MVIGHNVSICANMSSLLNEAVQEGGTEHKIDET